MARCTSVREMMPTGHPDASTTTMCPVRAKAGCPSRQISAVSPSSVRQPAIPARRRCTGRARTTKARLRRTAWNVPESNSSGCVEERSVRRRTTEGLPNNDVRCLQVCACFPLGVNIPPAQSYPRCQGGHLTGPVSNAMLVTRISRMSNKTWFITGTSRGFGREWTKAAGGWSLCSWSSFRAWVPAR